MLAQNSSIMIGLLSGALAAAWLVVVLVLFRHHREIAVVREALKGTSGQRLETLLKDHLASKQRIEDEYNLLKERVSAIEYRARMAVSNVGLIRYDAFEDVGGEQSFALALQSDSGDGALLTTIVGREQIRIYGKLIQGGRCEQSLTPEEQEALKSANRVQASRPSA